MANKAKTAGYPELCEMIMNKDFPNELLDVFVKEPPLNTGKRHDNPTRNQYDKLIKLGLYHDGLSKRECSYIIEAHKRSQGYEHPKDEIVPSGIHAGKHFKQVPFMYWKTIASKFPNSGVYKSYLEYRNKAQRSVE